MKFGVGRFVQSSPASAWALLASTRTWPSWGPSITAVDPADATLSEGMRGRVRTPVGLWVPFRITAYEPPRFWAWNVLGVPATSHTVEPVAAGCRVSFGVPAPGVAYLLVCRIALDRIAALLEADPDA